MTDDERLAELFEATARIFLDTMNASHVGQPVIAVCDTVAFWLSKFCVATMRAVLRVFVYASEKEQWEITQYLLTMFNTMFWKGVAEFNLMSNKEIQILKETSFRFPNITH